MTRIDNSRVLVISADPNEQQTIKKALERVSYGVESVFTPLDLMQILLRREFDVVIIGASLPADDSRLMWYARTIQPWLQAIVLGRPVRQDAPRSAFLARRMNVNEEQIVKIKRGALLHDIGKIGIPDAILQKAGPLTDAEKDIIRRHTAIGYNILKNIPFLQEEAEMVYQHHENYDGRGYPRGLAGKAITFGARLFALVDAFDALRSDRVYRKAVSSEDAVREIQRCSGSQFDPEIVKTFLACYKEMDGLYK